MTESLIKDDVINYEIKPALYALDNDQTHDFMMVDGSKVDSNIKSAFNGLDEHFPVLGHVWVIDRFTPDNHNWCDEWTSKFYPLLKEISRTWLVENDEYNGVNYGFEQKHPSFPNTLSLGEFPSKLKIKIPKEKTVILTWLEKQDGNKVKGITNDVSIWEKSFKIFESRDKERIEEIDCSKWLMNSCVITGDSYELMNGSYDLILYSKLDETISRIELRLNIPQIQVLTGIKITVDSYFTLGNVGLGDGNLWQEYVKIDTPLFQVVPESYYFCSLVKANNNIWKNGNIGTNIGRYASVSLGNSIAIGYYSDNNNSYPHTLEVFSFELYSVSLPEERYTVFSGRLVFSGVTIPVKQLTFVYLPINEAIESTWPPNTVYKQFSKNGQYIRTRMVGIEFDFGGDKDLFSTTETAIFKNSYDLGDDTNNGVGFKTVFEDNLFYTYKVNNLSGNGISATQDFQEYPYSNGYLVPVCQSISLSRELRVNPLTPLQNNENATKEFIDNSKKEFDNIRWEFIPKGSIGTLIVESGKGYVVSDNLTLILRNNSGVAILGDDCIINIDDNFYTGSYTQYFKDKNGNLIEDTWIMPDSTRVKKLEIQAQLISDFLGIELQPDGTRKKAPMPKNLDQKEQIADGWSFYGAGQNKAKQFNTGIYQKRSRKVKMDETGKAKIETGGFVETYNLLQILNCMQDDSTRMMGGDESSGFSIPTADGGYETYESLFQLIAQMAYTLSWVTMSINEIKINCMQLISMTRDTLKAIGVPMGIKTLGVKMDGKDLEIAVGGLVGNTPTVSSQIGILKQNIALVVASIIKSK
jgi:hypothetical protein